MMVKTRETAIMLRALGIISSLVLSPQGALAQDCMPTPQEKRIWESIKTSSEPREFLAYLKQFPKGCFRDLANFKIRSLVDELLPLQLSFVFAADSGWRSVKEGQW